MPAYTCSVVAHAISLSGNQPCFVDIKLDDYNMDLDLLAEGINEDTRAIIATHTFGYPQDIDRLESIVRDAEARYGQRIWLMQDCCHAFGAEWNGRMVGTSGDVAVYAFNISKIITSIFGGMLTFRDQGLADRVRAWRDAHYRKAEHWKALQRRLYLLAVYAAFDERIYGLTWWLQERTPVLNRLTKSYHLDDKIHFPPDYLDRMLEVEGAVGLAQLERYSEIIDRRRANAAWYEEHLERREGWIFPPIVEGATYSHYVVRVPNRARVIAEWAEKGIHLGELIQYSLPHLSSYQSAGNTCPHSLLASKSTINLPLHLRDISRIPRNA